MASFAEWTENEKKKKKKQQANGASFTEYTKQVLGRDDIEAPLSERKEDDIAPVMTTSRKKGEEDDGFDFFQKGAFEDGYQVGDIARTILGTTADAGVGIVKGIAKIGGGLIDAGMYGVAGVADVVGADDFADDVRVKARENVIDDAFRGTDDYLNRYSVLGRTSDAVAEGLGQVGAIILTGGLGASAGLGAAGTAALTTGTIGVSSIGSGMSEAYQGGASDEEAAVYGLISGVVNAGSELIFGGLGKTVKALGLSKGLSSLDDVFAQKLSSKIANHTAKSFVQYGVKASAEGVEEVLAGIGTIAGKKLTYMSDEELSKLIEDENLLEQFVVGAVTSGVAQSGLVPGMKSGSLKESIDTGRDFISGNTANEQAVIDKVYNDLIAEEEASGKKLTKREKTKLYDSVVEQMERGEISTDTIEEVLGGDSYKAYKDTIDSEDALSKEFEELGNKQNATLAEQSRYAELKQQMEDIKQNGKRNELKTQLSETVYGMVQNDRLAESYFERGRRGQAYQADVSKYDEKQKTVIQRAIDSGILNNTRRTHEFVDIIARLSADMGVLFDFTDNAKLKESGFAIDGKQVNGFVTKDGITLNIDSPKAWQSTVGHEVTHVLEGTELYGELQTALFDYAKTKGEYDSRLADLTELYSNIAGADVNAELTADLVGDYLFTDSDFIHNLSTNHRNVFQKIYDEIKYLLKVATAGSKEARQLEKVKKAFEDAYRADGKAADGTKYSVSNKNIKDVSTGYSYGESYYTMSYTQDGKVVGTLEYGEYEGAPNVKMIEVAPEYRRHGIAKKLMQELQNKYPDTEIDFGMSTPDGTKLLESITYNVTDEAVVADRQKLKDLQSELNELQSKLDVLYDTDNLTEAQEAELHKLGDRWTEVYDTIRELEAELRGKKATKTFVKTDAKYSVSDNNGKQLTAEQQEYFKDSKMRDDNGNLMVMYHGSQDAGFHVFDAKMSDDDTSFFFVDRNDVAATYSGTVTTFSAKEFRTADELNEFLAEIGEAQDYEVREEDGKFKLYDDAGDLEAESSTAQGLYEKFRGWPIMYHGNANYKVYLNLKNPLVVDAQGRNWNRLTGEFSQEVYDRYQSLTDAEKEALTQLAAWEDASIFRDELETAVESVERGASYVDDYIRNLASAAEKLGDADKYRLFDIAMDNFTEESLRENAVQYLKTRDYAQRAKEQGYDGVIFKNIVDNGNYASGREGASTVAVAFDSNQIKSVANEKPTADPDIRYSLSKDSEGRELPPAVKNRFGKSKVVDENGDLKVVYHGTATGEFTIFDKAKGSVEGDYGSGFYFTDNEADVSEHYEGGGPDFDNKVGRRADEIYGEVGNEDMDYDEAERRAREELFKGSHKFEVYLNMENPATVGETMLFDPDSYFSRYSEEDYDSYEDYEGDVEQLIADDIDNIIWEIERNVDVTSTDGIAQICWEAISEGGIGLEELKAKLNNLYLEGSNGNLVANEVARQIIESLGYDGIIDPTVSSKWNMDMEDGTTHYIVFKPNQIKAVTNENPTDNPDIHRSLSNNDTAPVKYGNFSTPARDLKLEAPVQETVAENATVEETPKGWRETIKTLREPEMDGDSWSREYIEYHDAFSNSVVHEALNEVMTDAEVGMSSAELAQKAQEALREYEQIQANKPYGESYTESEMLELSTLYTQYTVYDGLARNPAYIDELMSLLEYSAPTESELSEYDADRLASIDEKDMPPEVDAPYYEDSKPAKVNDPFYDRDIGEVGKRSVKAYMYENPEVKPFFQDEAKYMLGDLNNSQKAERYYADVDYLNDSGYTSHGVWTGTTRHTTDDIAYLLDECKYSYAEIEKGLKAIIEDNGAENNACSKRIEFMLNDRLMNGHRDVYGNEIPPNQEYINLLNEKQINEYSKEALDALGDADAPPVNDVAPVPRFDWKVTAEDFAPVTQEVTEDDFADAGEVAEDNFAPTTSEVTVDDFADVAPVKESYEAIRPKREKQPKLIRVDENNGGTPGEETTAKTLVEETKKPRKKRGLWSLVKEYVLDNGMVFEEVALRTKNRELQSKWHYIRGAQAMAQRFMGNGANGVRALNDIRQEVEKSGKVESFYKYLQHMLNTDRMTLAERYGTENKPVFGKHVTAEMSSKTAAELEAANPEFKQWAEDIYTIQRHLRSMMVEKGVISQETADLWNKMYPHYVPIGREGKDGAAINVALDTGRTGVNAPIKAATGGNADIRPMFNVMGERIVQTFRANAKNSFGVELFNTLNAEALANDAAQANSEALAEAIFGDTEGVTENEDGLLKEGKNGAPPTFTVFVDGKRVEFAITDEMYAALKPAGELLSYNNKFLNTASNIRRGLITEYNPVFLATNAIKDVQDVLMNSQHPVKTYLALPRAVAQIMRNGEYYTEYLDNGGESNTYFDNESSTFTDGEKGASKLLGIPPLSWISKANNVIERLPRLAEYIASREAGRSIETSMLDAARVTTNFAAGGKLTKLINRNGGTFFAASVNGAVQQARNIVEAKHNGLRGVLGLAGKMAIAGLPAMVFNALRWDDDEDYAELSDYVKRDYYVVAKYGDGQFVRIPKGRVLAVIQNAFEQGANAVNGEEVDLLGLGELMLNNIAPNNPLDNNIFAPVGQVLTNKTWYGEDLVPTRLQDKPTNEQYDESTDAISKWLGENFDPLKLGAYKINYLLDQYSGGVGDMFLPMLTPEAERGDNSLVGNMIAPFKDKFTTDSVMNNQNVSDFYDTKDELATTAKRSGATDEDVLMSKYMNSVNAKLSELYAEKRELQNSDLPAGNKYSWVRNVQKQIDEIARNALASYENVKIDGKHATVGDVQFRWYEPGEDSTAEPGWKKLTDDQLEQQGKVTRGLGISAGEYWDNKAEHDFAYEKPEKYAVARSVGGYAAYKGYQSELYDIKADKDSKGRSISGSRKEKVIDYINGLDADYGEKIILFKSEYNADDTYNQDIVDYLNSRNDISYDDTIAILKELGFEVDSKGNVYW